MPKPGEYNWIQTTEPAPAPVYRNYQTNYERLQTEKALADAAADGLTIDVATWKRVAITTW